MRSNRKNRPKAAHTQMHTGVIMKQWSSGSRTLQYYSMIHDSEDADDEEEERAACFASVVPKHLPQRGKAKSSSLPFQTLNSHRPPAVTKLKEHHALEHTKGSQSSTDGAGPSHCLGGRKVWNLPSKFGGPMFDVRSSLGFGGRFHPWTVVFPRIWSRRGVPKYLAGAAKVGPNAASKEFCKGHVGLWSSAKVAFACRMAVLTSERSRPKETSKAKLLASGARRTYLTTAEDPHRPCN